MNYAPSEERLQPEYIRAVNVLENNLDRLTPIEAKDISPKIWRQGNISMFFGALATKHIPSANSWRWNQTRSRKRTFLSKHNTWVDIVKLIPRKRNSSTTTDVPLYKLWMFEISCSTASASVLWCEKGEIIEEKEEKEEEPERTIELPAERKNSLALLEDLSFLADFMKPETAKLFWPTKQRNVK